jgi:FkbM family methyltransferase
MTNILKHIIQIGVANGMDHVRDFIIQNPNEYMIYMIEPNKYSIPLIKQAYEFTPFKLIGNYAISTFDGEIDIYFHHYESGNSQQASTIKDHVIKHNHKEEDLNVVKVKCFTLETLINTILSLNDEKIEYLCMDTEGYDCDIILSTDFSKFNVNCIVFERLHTEGAFMTNGNKYKAVENHLLSYGYTVCSDFSNGSENACFKK